MSANSIKVMDDYILAVAQTVAYDGEGNDQVPAPAPAPAPAPKDPVKPEPSDITFTPAQQAKIDAMLKEKAEGSKRAMAELEALKARNDLTDGQRKDLEQRFDTIQKELMTKEELFEQEKKKKDRQFNETVETLTSERDSWKNRYSDSKIIRAITDAASKNKAYDSDTLVAILRPQAELIESLNEEGKGTGKYTEKVRFLDPEGRDGKPAELLLTASEAVKRMTELPKYQYLFEGLGTGGLGQNNGANGSAPDAAKLAKDPEAYRKARKAGII